MKSAKIIKMMGAALCGAASNSVWLSPTPPIREIVRGEYEDKIRRYSPPQKIFSVFASMDANKKCTMSVHDLLRAICFYNYATSDNVHNKDYKPEHIFELLGKEDGFDIYDYFNFVRFISFSNEQLRAYFKEKNISSLNKSRFIEMMLEYVCQDYDQFIRKPMYLQSRQFKPSKEEYYKAVKQMGESLFGDRHAFTFDEMVRFRFEVMRQLYTFEFKSFCLEDESIDGVDFARSIVKYGENNHKRQLLRRIYWIEQRVQGIRIKEEEYVNFHMQLQLQLDQFQKFLDEKGAISRKELKTILTENIKLITEDQVDIFFSLLDVDDSNFLEKKQVFGVIKKLGYYWKVKSGENNLSQLLKQRALSFKNKSKRLIDLLLEQ